MVRYARLGGRARTSSWAALFTMLALILLGVEARYVAGRLHFSPARGGPPRRALSMACNPPSQYLSVGSGTVRCQQCPYGKVSDAINATGCDRLYTLCGGALNGTFGQATSARRDRELNMTAMVPSEGCTLKGTIQLRRGDMMVVSGQALQRRSYSSRVCQDIARARGVGHGSRSMSRRRQALLTWLC